jgi:cellulose synthase operon protein C
LLKASMLNSGIMRPEKPEQIGLSYYQAALFCEMIEEKYGFERIRQSLLLFAENKPVEEVFLRTLGLDSAALDAAYDQYVDSKVKQIAAYLNFTGPEQPEEGGQSKEKLERMLQINPDDFFSNLRMGALLRKEGANGAAETYLKKAQELYPEYIEPGNPYQILGEMYLGSNREGDALTEFESWSRQDGESTIPLLKAAEIYAKRKDWDSITRILALAVFVNPYDLEMQRKLGEAAMESGKWTSAVAAFRSIAGMNPSDPAGAHYDLARALLASGKRPEAKREVLRSLEIAPSYKPAQKLLLKMSGANQ